MYLHGIGGAAQIYAQCVQRVLSVRLEQFGSPEAVWELEVKNFPASSPSMRMGIICSRLSRITRGHCSPPPCKKGAEPQEAQEAQGKEIPGFLCLLRFLLLSTSGRRL